MSDGPAVPEPEAAPAEASPAPPAVDGVALPPPALLVLGGLILVACHRGLLDMGRRWFEEGSYYGHGPLIPLAAGWLVWREREHLGALPRGSSAAAPLLAWAALPLLLVGLLEDVLVLQNGAFLLGALGLALLAVGAPRVRAAWWAWALLGFMVPLPGLVIEAVTFRLKLLAAWLAVGAMDLAGVHTLLEGGTIHMPSTSVEVADACAGLRTLVTLMALGAVFACLQPTRRKGALLLLLAAPVAILANVVRILVLCWFASIGHPAAREGPLHEATGLGVYALALLLFLGLQALPLGDDPAPTSPTPSGSPPRAAPPPSQRRCLAFAAPWAVGALLSLLVLLRGGAGEAPGEPSTRRIPATIAAWSSVELPLGDEVWRVLHTRDAIFRHYTRAPAGEAVDLYVTCSRGDIFQVAHAPERCFAGGGYVEESHGRSELDGAAGATPIPANRILFRRDEERVLVYYWYRVDGQDVPSYLAYRMQSFLRRLSFYRSQGSMVRLSTEVGPDGLEAAEARVRAFAAEALPEALAPLAAR